MQIDVFNLWSCEHREQIIYTGQLLSDTLKQIVCKNTRGLWDPRHTSFVQRRKSDQQQTQYQRKITRRRTPPPPPSAPVPFQFAALSINSISSSPQHTYGICGRIVFYLKLRRFSCFTWKSNWTKWAAKIFSNFQVPNMAQYAEWTGYCESGATATAATAMVAVAVAVAVAAIRWIESTDSLHRFRCNMLNVACIFCIRAFLLHFFFFSSSVNKLNWKSLTSYLIGLIVPICSVCNVTFGYCPMYTNANEACTNNILTYVLHIWNFFVFFYSFRGLFFRR